jgi:hypothetical protein
MLIKFMQKGKPHMEYILRECITKKKTRNINSKLENKNEHRPRGTKKIEERMPVSCSVVQP